MVNTAEDTASQRQFIAQRNVVCLRQGHDLLQGLSDADYLRSAPPVFPQGIGAHIRHVVDHYRCFLRGLATGAVDYDARDREAVLERDRAAAMVAMREVAAQLDTLTGDDGELPLRVRMDSGGAIGPARDCSGSSVSRELQFLLSHTVHHYALLALKLRSVGIEPPPGLGVAPSTIRYLEDRE